MDDFDYNNHVTEFTRVARKFYKKKNKYITSKTIIDVVLHNRDLVQSTKVVNCPYSDHKFVVTKIKLPKNTNNAQSSIMGRMLNEKNVDLIVKAIKDNVNLKVNTIKLVNVNDHLNVIHINLNSIVDSVAPVKKIKIKQKNYCSWMDEELLKVRDQRNFYFNLKNSYDENSPFEKRVRAYELYTEFRSAFQKLNRIKMTDYYAKKNIQDFKNSKNFWKFYSASIRIRSDKTTNFNEINIFDTNNNLITDPAQVSNHCNSFFTNLKSESLASNEECDKYIFENFRDLKNENKLKTSNFEFKKVSINLVDKLLSKLDTSCGPGVSGISTKVLKAAHEELAPVVTELFNKCIETKTIPNEWKLAVVTPLYKSKGIKTDLNNYR